MKVTNKWMIQSYLITAARYDFNVYEQRILYRLVEICQPALEGQKLNANYQVNSLLYDDLKEVIMPISAFLKDEKDENYSMVKKALYSLRNKTFEVADENEWKLIGIIEMPKVVKRGYVKFILQKEIYEAILNFSKGFRKFELKIAMSFDSVYSMRFYELLSGKEGQDITYSIEHLKIMFKIEDKYRLTTDFIRKIIEPAKRELAKKAPISFEYTLNKTGKKFTSITFHVYRVKENVDEDLERKMLEKKTALSWDLDKMIVNYLKENYLFDTDEIKHNRQVFVEASKKMDLLRFLSDKRAAANQKSNPKGWLINAIRKELAVINAKAEAEEVAYYNTNEIAGNLANKFRVK